jgi:hypothetical protein
MKIKSTPLLAFAWLLMSFCGCQWLGLNQQGELDDDMPYFSLPDTAEEEVGLAA